MSSRPTHITTRFKAPFPGYRISTGFITLVVAAMSILYQDYLPLLVVPMGLGIITFSHGALIDPGRNRYKHYLSFFGVKLGRWQSCERYPDLVILRQVKNFESRIPLNVLASLSISHTDYEIYLASPRHLDLVLLDICHDPAEADKRAHLLAQDLGKNFMQYNPGRRKKPQALSNGR